MWVIREAWVGPRGVEDWVGGCGAWGSQSQAACVCTGKSGLISSMSSWWGWGVLLNWLILLPPVFQGAV